MEKIFRNFVLTLILLLGGAISSNAQTTLSPGDLVIVSINGDADATNNYGRGFSFMTLVDLEAGTIINFTDYGWSDVTGAFISNTGVADAFIHYTAPSNIAAGTIIRCDEYTNANFTFDYTYAGTGSNPYLNTAGLSSSDELLVFQGARSAPVFITATTFVTTGWATSVGADGVASGSGSALPGSGNASIADLVDDVTALSFNQLVGSNDNSSYSGLTTPATKAEWQSRISNYSNWTFNDVAPIPTPLVGPFTITAPVISATVTTQAISAITSTTATGNGNITSLGSPNPTEYGVVWSTSANPTIALTTKTTQGAVNATGAFTSSITGLAAGTTYYVKAYATNTAGTSYGAEVSFTTQSTPTITWANPADITYGTLLSATQLNATASVSGTFTYTPAMGAKLNAGATQNLKVDFTPTDLVHYLATSKTVTITVSKATSVITWSNPTGITYGTLLGATQLDATSDVAGTMVYTPASGAKLNAGSAQDLHVSFTPTDATNYSTAFKSVTIDVSKATPVISWDKPSNISYGTLLGATQLDATSDVAGTLVYTPASGAKLNAGSAQDLHVSFTPTDATNYSTAFKSVTIDVSKATPVITWEDPDDISKGMALSANQLNATANVAGSFVYTPALGTVLSIGADQSLLVEFTPTDVVNYSEGTKTVLITVNSPVGIHKTKTNAFKVYPNPMSDRIMIDGLTERAVLMVSDLNGRVFMNEEIENKESVSISSLPNGTYLVNVLIEGKSEATVFMKK